MAAVNVIRAALVSILVVLIIAGTGQILVLYITAFALGVCQVVYDSAARARAPVRTSPDYPEPRLSRELVEFSRRRPLSSADAISAGTGPG